MRSTFQLRSGIRSVLIVGLASTIQAHSWIEQLSIIASNGTFVGTPGYPRGFIQRTEPDFADANLINLIPPNGRSTGNAILSTDLMCRESQFVGNQTQNYPALTAAPGDQIAMTYQENGHVTLLQNSPAKPVGSGTIYIYGTKQPANTDTYLGIHRVWDTAGTGGDKRGKLLATRPFDNGQCFQNNTSPLAESRRKQFNPLGNDLKCQSDVQIPSEAGTAGMYTLYWVWEWPTLDTKTGAVITNESYTTCMDIDMTAGQFPSAGNFDTKQVVDYAAIEEQISSAYLINPTIAEQLTGAVAQPTAAGDFVTVTVTTSAGATTETVTVTQIINGGTSSPTPIPTPISTVTLVLGAPFQASNFEPAPTQAMKVKPFYTDHAFHRTGRHARGLKVRNCNLRT